MSDQKYSTNSIGAHFEVHLTNQLDRINDKQELTLRSLDRIETKIREPRKTEEKKKHHSWLTPQMMFYLVIIALAIGGHITIDQAKTMLMGSPH